MTVVQSSFQSLEDFSGTGVGEAFLYIQFLDCLLLQMFGTLHITGWMFTTAVDTPCRIWTVFHHDFLTTITANHIGHTTLLSVPELLASVTLHRVMDATLLYLICTYSANVGVLNVRKTVCRGKGLPSLCMISL
jgi:hypothetical protein